MQEFRVIVTLMFAGGVCFAMLLALMSTAVTHKGFWANMGRYAEDQEFILLLSAALLIVFWVLPLQ